MKIGIVETMGTEDELLLLADGARNLLDQDDVPNANQSLTCFSCDTPLTGLYCHACGNKNDNYRRSIFSLIIEMFQNLTAVDGRMWRSVWSLVRRPGQMARDYADGARTRWTSPIRMFLATSLMLFGYIAFTDTQIVSLGALSVDAEGDTAAAFNFIDDDGKNYDQRLLWFKKRSDIVIAPDGASLGGDNAIITEIREALDEAGSAEALAETLEDFRDELEDTDNSIERRMLEDVIERIEERLAVLNADGVDADANPSDAADDDGSGSAAPDISSITEGSTINITGIDGRRVTLDGNGMSELYNQIRRNPEVINDELNTKLKWAMFFMMPFAMFMGAIFIRGRQTAMLYDHLVHAAYVHAFSFLLLLVFIVLSQSVAVSGLLLIYTLILMVYLPISAKGAFKRGWFKSVLTAYGVGAVYTLIMIITAVVIIATALTDIAQGIIESASLEAAQSAPSSPVDGEAPSLPETPSDASEPPL